MGRGDRLLGQAGAVCSGCALTQEGNRPFMEAPRALRSVHVCEAGEGPQWILRPGRPPQAQHSQGQMGRWQRSRLVPAEPRASVGSWVPACAQPLTPYVTLGKSLIPLSLSFPISFTRTESCEKELKAWELEGEGGYQGHS